MSTTIFSVFLLFLGVQGIYGEGEQNATVFDDIFYDTESNVTYPLIESVLTPTKEFTYGSPSCHCFANTCSCCAGVRLKLINFDRRVCIILTRTNTGVKITLTVDGKEIISQSISTNNPSEICTSIPAVSFGDLCIGFNDLYIIEGKLHACSYLAVRLTTIPILKLRFHCVVLERIEST